MLKYPPFAIGPTENGVKPKRFGNSKPWNCPQYSNYIDDWIKGNYLPLLYYSEFSQFPNSDVIAVLTLHPGGKT